MKHKFLTAQSSRAPKTRKNKGFDPDHEQIKSAVDEFLKNGGKIKKIETIEDNSTEELVVGRVRN